MKRLLLSAAITFTALGAFADFEGDGYYRVQNAVTKRYAYLLDNKGSFDASMGTADVKALKLFMNPERMESDPAGIFYIDCVSGEGTRTMTCNIAGQGTSLYDFFNQYMKVFESKEIDGKMSYLAYASRGGATKYLGDRRKILTEDEGVPDVEASGDYRLWYIDPVIASSNNSFFGIAPTLSAIGGRYKPFYAAFPFDLYSEGMKVYVVSQVDSRNQIAVIKEVSGVVPASTPVIIQCSSSEPTGNRLNIGGQGSAVGSNRLKGVYFNNDRPYSHRNRTPYDKKTMRMLTERNGDLYFEVASDLQYLPRNEAYLQLSGDQECAVQSYRVMREAEYESQFGAVGTISIDSKVDVYNLAGNLLVSGISKNEVSSLGKGLYILRSGGVSEKMIVK